MEFRHLRYFLVLADELHFGRAAQKLSISQPPLSLNIQHLEASVGARLFDRDSKGVRLTAAGTAFRPLAQGLLTQADKARQIMRDVAAGADGRVSVGMVDSMVFRGLPLWLEAYRLRHPQVEVTLCEGHSQEQIDLLLRDEISLGFIHMSRVPDALTAVSIYQEEFICCVHAEHRLAAKPAVSLLDLRDEPWILFAPESAPDYYARIIEMAADHGFEAQIRHRVRSWLSIVSLVSQRMGIAVVPASLSRSMMAGVSFRRLTEVSRPSEVFCIWKPTTDSPWRDAFLDIVRAGSMWNDRPA